MRSRTPAPAAIEGRAPRTFGVGRCRQAQGEAGFAQVLHVLVLLQVLGWLRVFGWLHVLGWLQVWGWLQPVLHELQAASVRANVVTANSERRRRIDASWFENWRDGTRTLRPSSLGYDCTHSDVRTHVSAGDSSPQDLGARTCRQRHACWRPFLGRRNHLSNSELRPSTELGLAEHRSVLGLLRRGGRDVELASVLTAICDLSFIHISEPTRPF